MTIFLHFHTILKYYKNMLNIKLFRNILSTSDFFIIKLIIKSFQFGL